MADINKEELKAVAFKKTTPNTIILTLHSIDNPDIKRTIVFSNRLPRLTLPISIALGIFTNPYAYNLLIEKKLIIDSHAQEFFDLAEQEGVFVNDPAERVAIIGAKDDSPEILTALKSGIRSNIDAWVKKDESKVKEVAIAHRNELTAPVLKMLENTFHIILVEAD